MAFQPPPKFYPPVTLDEGSSKYELTQPWHIWFLNVGQALNGGYTGVIPLAKLTGGGADGSITVTNGLITAVTAPT